MSAAKEEVDQEINLASEQKLDAIYRQQQIDSNESRDYRAQQLIEIKESQDFRTQQSLALAQTGDLRIQKAVKEEGESLSTNLVFRHCSVLVLGSLQKGAVSVLGRLFTIMIIPRV